MLATSANQSLTRSNQALKSVCGRSARGSAVVLFALTSRPCRAHSTLERLQQPAKLGMLIDWSKDDVRVLKATPRKTFVVCVPAALGRALRNLTASF